MKRREFIRNTAAAMASMSVIGLASSFKKDGIPYRRLGKTGLDVSLIGVGGYHIGDRFISDETSVKLIREALDSGVNFLDNAWHYNDGRSETLMGKALLGGYREKAILMTKHHGRDIKTAEEHLEASLKRLQTDYLDLWQFHEIESMDSVEKIYSSGVLEYVQKKKAEGVIRHIGFTGHSRPEIHKAMIEKGFEWETVQMPLNVLDHHYLSFSQEIIPMLVERNIGIIGMKSVASGAIVKEGIATIEECLRFSMTLPVSTVVSGMNNLEHLRHNLEITRNFEPMTEDEIASLMSKTFDHAQGGKYEWYKDKV
ncbi:aldo/keto reductase [Mangrovibacterium lignilyticum]|uniref:aldo/keto reductase n=1 Tax=Mangrovibacterium lignilyticum TaxID=2668052 RepID=UPI0013D812FF|nr:aldo/keto reductase [Mangrovibacterium lignilyticum]